MTGLFIGLTTLDLIYLVSEFPHSNQKLVALEQTIAAGGPATNAAVTFSYLKNQTKLVTVLGSHPLHHLIKADLATYLIDIYDLKPDYSDSPPLSSILVTKGTGERSVISLNAKSIQVNSAKFPVDFLHGINIILVDGHQIPISYQIAQIAQKLAIPIVLDGGSWKEGLDILLPYITYAICSANFLPPGCQTREDIYQYLLSFAIPHIAISAGEHPLQYYSLGEYGEIPIPPIKVVDTLGAGDVLHGAFCHYIQNSSFIPALEKASLIASKSCQTFGTRQWLQLFSS